MVSSMTHPNIIVTEYNLNLIITHNLELLQIFFKDTDVSEICRIWYINDEEKTTTIKYLENLRTANEMPFVQVIS